MTHRCVPSPGRAALPVLFCMVMAVSASCRPGRNNGGAGPAGGTGTGGATESTSSRGSLGGGGAKGGSSGAGTTESALGGGGAGAGGTTASSSGPPPANIPCTGNAECVATGQVCESATKLCVPCVKTSDCPSGGHCLGNRCVTFTSCSSKADCSNGLICDVTRGVCAQCTADTDCPTNNDCYGGKCVPVAACQRNSDCSVGVCDTSSGRCIDCVSHDNCGASNKRCLLNVCRTVCTSNADCGEGMVCDTSVNACKRCVSNKDCPASWYCLVSVCVPDVCDATQSACNGTSVAGCSADGDTFNAFTTCGATKPCTVRGAVATCGGVPFKDGGASDGPSGAEAGVSSCSGGTTADPCKSGLPKFTGSQTVDGDGSELCTLPTFVLNAQNAAKVINSNNVPTSQFETATARVGWDAAGLHAYIDVQDSAVQTASMVVDSSQAVSKAYLGDSIELFLSSGPNVTGTTASDSNTIHLIIPASGPAVSVKDTGSSGTPTALSSTQYAQTITRTGYAIEVLIPWPGSAPSQGGAVRFDMALNSADKNFAGIDKMRDGQLIFYVGTVSGSTTCQSSDGTVPWCDDRTWCQTTVQ